MTTLTADPESPRPAHPEGAHLPIAGRRLSFAALADDGTGRFGPASTYLERLWLPVLGPTGTLLWRRLALELERRPVVVLEAGELAGDLGVGPSPLGGSLTRLGRFGLLVAQGDAHLVRRRLPPVGEAQLRRLRPDVVQLHRRLVAEVEAPQR